MCNITLYLHKDPTILHFDMRVENLVGFKSQGRAFIFIY